VITASHITCIHINWLAGVLDFSYPTDLPIRQNRPFDKLIPSASNQNATFNLAHALLQAAKAHR
jgi:hypothetical protein